MDYSNGSPCDVPTIWTEHKAAPPDPVFGLIHNYIADENP